MAEEQVTDATNSEATQTDAAEATASTTSTTDQTQTDSPPKADAASTDTEKTETPPTEEKDALGDGDGVLTGKEEGEQDEGETNTYIGAPEGDYELSLPEGMTLDPDALGQIAPTAKEIGLSNDGLSRLASEAYPVVEGQVQKAMVQQVVAQRKAWADASKAAISGGTDAEGNAIAPDPVYSGQTMDEVTATAASAMDRFTNDAAGQPLMFPGAKEDGSEGTFRDFLRSTGLTNHPAMVRFAYMAGRSISEDNDFHRSGDVPKGKLSREEKYYGTQT